MPVPSRGQPQMSIEQLDKKAIEHWEVSAQLAGSRAIFILSRQTILHYMVDTNSSAQRPGGGALHLLVAGGWLEEGRGCVVKATLMLWLTLLGLGAEGTKLHLLASNFSYNPRGHNYGTFYSSIFICRM